MRTFQAILHDREKQLQYPATVQTQPDVLVIRLETSTGPQTLRWTLPELHTVRTHPDGSIILQHFRQFLEITDRDFQAEFERTFPQNRLLRKSFFDRIGVGGCLATLAIVLLPLLAFFWWGVPALADRAANMVSPETERQIGDAWYKALTAAYTVDSAKTRLIRQFYDSLNYGGVYDMRITVVREPVVNAFAMPGGRIVVFDSLIGLTDAPEQLAALLAHEASHVQLKHSTRAIFRELANGLLLSLLLGDYGDISGIVAQQGGELAGLSYSRQLELEADDQALQLLRQSGLPQRGMPDLFRRMQSSLQSGAAVEIPDFLSTHPSMDERLRIAEEKITAAGTDPGAVKAGLRQIWEELKEK